MTGSETLLDILRRDGRVSDPYASLTPLAGGVSSDIYLVSDGDNRFVVKRALAKLRVRGEWFASVGRNATEQEYIRCISSFMPEVVPRLTSSNPHAGYFCMEFLGSDFDNWKNLLLDGVCLTEHAARAGEILGIIHHKTAGDTGIARKFETSVDFHQLRLEPYLLTTGRRHPGLREYFEREAARLETTRETLVHGDFSPKNILICGGRMVLLDCEVAWYGDPAFDCAFLLNHFFLKALYHAPINYGLEEMAASFLAAYRTARGDGAAQIVEQRLVPLLLMLLLARVDGKSPAEYLAEPKRRFIRDFVTSHLPEPPDDLASLGGIWFVAVVRSFQKDKQS